MPHALSATQHGINHAAMFYCRASGASDLPMVDAVPFQSPPTMEVELRLPNAGAVRGMGIRKGVTLIVGGGYNGKSTLLQALEKGVYNKVRRPTSPAAHLHRDPGLCPVLHSNGHAPPDLQESYRLRSP
jgi:Predicted ATPase of the ABC class